MKYLLSWQPLLWDEKGEGVVSVRLCSSVVWVEGDTGAICWLPSLSSPPVNILPADRSSPMSIPRSSVHTAAWWSSPANATHFYLQAKRHNFAYFRSIFVLLHFIHFYSLPCSYSLTMYCSCSSPCLGLKWISGRHLSSSPCNKILHYIWTNAVTCQIPETFFSSPIHLLLFHRMTSLLTINIIEDMLQTHPYLLLSHKHALTGWPTSSGGWNKLFYLEHWTSCPLISWRSFLMAVFAVCFDEQVSFYKDIWWQTLSYHSLVL